MFVAEHNDDQWKVAKNCRGDLLLAVRGVNMKLSISKKMFNRILDELFKGTWFGLCNCNHVKFYRGVHVLLKFQLISQKLESSSPIEFWVSIGNCHVKEWKSAEHKLHKNLVLSKILAKRVQPWIDDLPKKNVKLYWPIQGGMCQGQAHLSVQILSFSCSFQQKFSPNNSSGWSGRGGKGAMASPQPCKN